MSENVIEIGEARIKRKAGKYCSHDHLSYDPMCKTIECNDCGAFIDPFNAFLLIVKNFTSAKSKIDRDMAEIAELREKGLSLIAAKKAEKAWRQRNMVPTCPHCSAAIFPNDGFGNSMVNKEHAMQKRVFSEGADR